MTTTLLARRTILAGMVLALCACGDGLTEVNENPNAPTDVGAAFLLPQSIQAGVTQAFDAGMMLSHTAIWPQHAVEIQYPDEEEGLVRDSRMQGYWDNFYAGPLSDIQLVIDKGVDGGNGKIEGVGMIWRSWLYHIVTDSWGDIPYSEALQGAENTTPAYDAQQAVYQGLLADLTAGVSKLSASGSSFGSGDILYGDDMQGWARFANSLRMRLAMRMSEADPSGARSAFVAAYNAGGFTSNDDNASLAWPGAPYRNPLFENWQGRDDHGVSATMIDTLKSLADPRLQLYAEPAQEDGEYRGLQNGDITPEFSISFYSRIGDYWRANGAATPTLLMTYAEVLFLQAEAAARGWIAGDPATLYEQGIRAAMTQYPGAANAPTAAEIDAYLAQPRIQYTGMSQIQLQQWIGLYMNGSEAWAHVRRTDVPHLMPGPDLTLSRIPVRFHYPSLEQSLNNENLQAAVSRQGGGLDLVTPLWWMPN